MSYLLFWSVTPSSRTQFSSGRYSHISYKAKLLKRWTPVQTWRRNKTHSHIKFPDMKLPSSFKKILDFLLLALPGCGFVRPQLPLLRLHEISWLVWKDLSQHTASCQGKPPKNWSSTSVLRHRTQALTRALSLNMSSGKEGNNSLHTCKLREPPGTGTLLLPPYNHRQPGSTAKEVLLQPSSQRVQ